MSNEQNALVTVLDWGRGDVEQRLGFRGQKYTDANNYLTILGGLLFAGVVMAIAYFLPEASLHKMLWKRGITPFFIIPFATWALVILLVKWRKLAFQKRALDLMVVPQGQEFTLSPATAPVILDRMYGLVDNPKHFVLLSRIERALSNLRNIGVIADVSEMLRAQSENDEAHMESSYNVVKGLIWGIPVLGFIGTVLGLSQAIGGFGTVLAAGGGLEDLKGSLESVTLGLSVAFDTTLIGLVAALAIELLMRALRKKEEGFLDDCKDYCHLNIVSKLRLIPMQDGALSIPQPVPPPVETP